MISLIFGDSLVDFDSYTDELTVLVHAKLYKFKIMMIYFL